MKISNCYNCNCRSDESTFYAKENGFVLVKCNECGLLYVAERPDDNAISQAHKQGKHSGLKKTDATGRFNADKIVNYLNALEDIFQGNIQGFKTWLDVGCGHGEFMMAVKNYSYENINIRGTEPNIHKQKSARERGLNVGFFDLDSHNAKYDVISFMNVYSHLPDPPRFIDALRKLLNSGGSLIIQTGDTADLSAKDHYRPFNLPDHLSFPSERIVVGILERLGFKIMKVKKYPFLRFNPKQIAKEVVKSVLPQHKHRSRIKYYVKWGYYSQLYSQTDMYIWAKLKN